MTDGLNCFPLGEEKQTPGSLPSVFASVGLNLSDFETNSKTSELMARLHKLLTGNSDARDASGYKSSKGDEVP